MAEKFDWTQVVGYVSILVVFVCLLLVGPYITGRQVDTTGVVNVTITSTASVSFVDDFIDFGPGQVDAGQSSATINSWGQASVNGNWSTFTDYMMLENVGNTNATVTLTSANNASGFIGGTSPGYYANITVNEAGACTAGGDITSLGALTIMNTSAREICDPLTFYAALDTINISIQLTIPADAVPGQKTDTITAAATAA